MRVRSGWDAAFLASAAMAQTLLSRVLMRLCESEVLVGSRYLARGFLDAALALFVRNAPLVAAADWETVVDRLMKRRRIADVVRVCRLGSIPLPRARLLELGDAALARRDVESAKDLYEIAEADTERWSRLLDFLIGSPERSRMALAVAARHLGDDQLATSRPRAAAAS
jgi:hypothetical protein